MALADPNDRDHVRLPSTPALHPSNNFENPLRCTCPASLTTPRRRRTPQCSFACNAAVPSQHPGKRAKGVSSGANSRTSTTAPFPSSN
ncbi:hypothetical protein M407DRAFT_119846 [Tulasnella calospora MUT 4182]|uniref:Uncharacterized protein n=1 Tax=Tulasnella calospora MUT 4182 TaxID=1051891 RepID=A0A0C3QCB2_9AGAM|nr:hypothetical protein M407DRAFT_119846 [Tulasnella calospora MUT 4182]